MSFSETALVGNTGGDASAASTPIPSTLRGKRQRTAAARQAVDEGNRHERFLFVMTAEDPLLPQATSTTAGQAAGSSWTQATSAEDVESNQNLSVPGNTGLPSPSPSPEDGERRKPKSMTNGTTSANQSSNPATAAMMDTPAETSPATMTSLIQDARARRSRKGAGLCTLAGNTDSKYDYTTWRDLSKFYTNLQVAVALIETEVEVAQATPEPSTTERLVHSLVRSAEHRLDKVDAVERESPWWTEMSGTKTLIGGFVKPKFPVETEIEMPKPFVETEKNLNGEFLHSNSHRSSSALYKLIIPRSDPRETAHLRSGFASRAGSCQRSQAFQGGCRTRC